MMLQNLDEDTDRHEYYMSRCFQLARNGLGTTYPNPLVGCVIVYQNKIIGEGWHRIFGGPHAEVKAIESVKDKSLLKNATLYVNLEPCSHYGKTPPCADLIIKHQIPCVVIANKDPNPKVKGQGIQKLKENECHVIEGIKEKEGYHLNKRFFTFQNQKRPYIILKWAQSQDGFIDQGKSLDQPPSQITNPLSRQLTHKWRSEQMAILVGTRTAIKDNPELTVRSWKGKNPIRILIDRDSVVPIASKIMNTEAKTLIVNASKEKVADNLEWIKIDFDKPLASQICSMCYDKHIQSVLVEGGAKTHQHFINEQLWDEARVFTSPKILDKGIKASKLKDFSLKRDDNFILGDRLQYFFR